MSAVEQRALFELFIRSLREAVEALTGQTADVRAEPDPAQAPGPIRWWRQRLSYPEGARVWTGATEEDSADLGNRVLQAAGLGEAAAGEARSTFAELLQQAVSAFAGSLGARFGRELRASEIEEIASPEPPDSLRLVIVLPGAGPVALWVAFEGFGEGAQQAAEAALAAVTSAPSPGSPGQSIDLLLDVELPVSVSFGRTQLPLKEVLKLTSGSIVELNRLVTDPVEVIVNNCVIARGEVVVVEGNYGVRITEIISRQQRLRTLG